MNHTVTELDEPVDSLEELLDKLPDWAEYAVLAVKTADDKVAVIHAVGYESEPTFQSACELVHELMTDPQFKMTHLVFSRDYQLLVACRKTRTLQ